MKLEGQDRHHHRGAGGIGRGDRRALRQPKGRGSAIADVDLAEAKETAARHGEEAFALGSM